MPQLRNFSASQINAFVNCARVWYLGWVLKIRGPKTIAQQRGTDIHGIVEYFIRTGEILANWPGCDPAAAERNERYGYVRYVEWMVKHLPPRDEEDLYVEQEIFLDTPSGEPIWGYDEATGVPLVGYIDLGLFGRVIPEVWDLKTTSNMRYAKTPAELNQDIQLNTYARWVFQRQASFTEVKAKHIYCKVESGAKPAPKRIRSEKILPVHTMITREGNNEVWGRMQGLMSQMNDLAAQDITLEDINEIKPNLNFCPAYGGCEHKEHCGVSEKEIILTIGKGANNNMSFMDKIKKQAAAQGKVADTAAKAPEPKVKAQEPEPEAKTEVEAPKTKAGAFSFADRMKNKPIDIIEEPKVLPPDAPARTTTEERGAELRGEAQTKVEKAATSKAATPKKKRTTKKHKRELTLYFGCTPQKGEHQTYMLADDWTSSLMKEIDAQIREQTNQGYWALSYADQKSVLTEAVQGKVDEGAVPSVLVCNTGGLCREITNILIPVATDVVAASK
jgi:hypothetical protein